MKRTLFLLSIVAISISACRKNNDSGDSGGSWKLTEVFDKNTSTASHAPAGSNMDVVITFLAGNKFAGHTLRNTFSGGSFNLNGNEIVFGGFSMTKVMEDEWGGNFLTVLNACPLQSSSPCTPSVLTIRGNLMTIKTPLRYDVTLERL